MPIEEIQKFLFPESKTYDVAIGSREVIGAKRYNEPTIRHYMGRIFNFLIRILVLPDLKDTQCGFKCFKSNVADAVFPLQTMTGMSFDVEILYIARKLGFSIEEIPINWYFNSDSRVRIFRDSLQMAFDIFIIRQNAKRGFYQ